MKDKILKEAIKWYESQNKENIYIEDFINVIIDKTTSEVFSNIKDELNEEFEKGILKQPFVISNDYYLYLKLKDIQSRLLPIIEKEKIKNKEEKD